MTKYRSKIFVKGEREARIIPEAAARAMKVPFDDEAIPGFHIIRGGSLSLRKDEVRLIEVLRDSTQSDEEYSSYWVIYSKARRSIWKHPFSSRAEAQAELDLQLMALPLGAPVPDWQIEEQQSRNKRD